MRTYADRLLLHRSLGSTTDLDAVREVVRATVERTERRPLVVVDYLQKVYVPEMPVEDERVTVVVEGLKDLALDLEVPVLAIVAADKEGLGPGRRVRVHHLRGSSALAYEADIVLMLNDKYDIVAKHHLVYDPANADRYRQHVVLSVEKNRSGLDRIDLQLRKRFEQARYETEAVPVGRAAARRPRLQGVAPTGPASAPSPQVSRSRQRAQGPREFAHAQRGLEQRLGLGDQRDDRRQVPLGEAGRLLTPGEHHGGPQEAPARRAGDATPPAARPRAGDARCRCPR